MISGSEIEIRHAIEEEIDDIKKLFDQHKTELGFVVKSALLTSIRRAEVIVAVNNKGEIIGVVHYRHRKDGQTTLYSIIVDSRCRQNSIGRDLVQKLKQESHLREQEKISLKCPVDLSANKFYEALGFSLQVTEQGKHRALNIWHLIL